MAKGLIPPLGSDTSPMERTLTSVSLIGPNTSTRTRHHVGHPTLVRRLAGERGRLWSTGDLESSECEPERDGTDNPPNCVDEEVVDELLATGTS